MPRDLLIIAGIPAYNEEKTIAKVVLLTKKYVDEVVVVDDGSKDMTAQIAEALGATVIRHERNMGKGAAIMSIIRHAKIKKPDILVLLDADLQHDPTDIPKIIRPIIEGKADIVIGSRFKAGSNIPKVRHLGYRFLSILLKGIIKSNITDVFSGYRALSRKAYENINLTEKGYGTEVEMLIEAEKLNLKIVEVPIRIYYNTGTKTSKKHATKQGTEIIRTIIKKTIEKHPLLSLGFPGSILLIVGLYFAIKLIKLFNASSYFSLPLAISAVGFSIGGIILIMTSLIIYILINNVIKRN